MKFVEGSWYHYLYMLSPFIIIALLYLIFNKKSEKTKYIVGVVIGVLSLGVLALRNVDIFIRNGFDPQIIPLQVCHFGNIVVFIALVFKSKIATAMAWTFNLIPAYSSLVVVDALTGYANIFTSIRAQAYIWGHLLIIVGAMYPVVLKTIKFDKKSFNISLAITAGLFAISIFLNTYFTDFLKRKINYFYAYNSNGVPFKDFYNLGKPITIGSWFTVNLVYVAFLIVLGLVVIYLMYGASRLLYRTREKQ